MYISCPRCSQQNYPNATQCAYCGTPLSPSNVAQGAQPPVFGSTNAPGFSSGGTGAGPGQEISGTASQPQVGQLIDRKYRVERVLGEGGMGVVYLAVDVNADQYVVIKSIRSEFASRSDFRERTLQEGKALAKIDHQNVVRFYSIINHPETNELYIVMQFIEGESLDRTLEKANAAGQKLPVNEVLRLFKQILDGVGAAHREGLIHRDLKPANVLVRAKDGIAKVMDFGIAKAEGATKGPTQAGGIVGSLWYMAPEQIKGARDLDKRLDIYALGVVLYELLTGVVPFDGDTEYDIMTRHMSEPVPSVRQLRPDAPPWIDEIIATATAKERAQRYQTCEDMRAAIDRFDGGLQVPRSMTALENPAAPDYGVARPAHGSGTAVMAPSGGYGATTGGSAAAVSSTVPTKKAPIALFVGIAAVVLVGGGIGAYVYSTSGPNPDNHSGTAGATGSSGSSKATGAAGGKGTLAKAGGEVDTGAAGGAHKIKRKDPLDLLVGTWKTDTTNRLLKAVRAGDEVEFRVVSPADWDGAYVADEIRFKLQDDGDGDVKTYGITDRYRPAAGKLKYARGAYSTCLLEVSKVKGKLLQAELKGNDDVLDVRFATASLGLLPEPGDPTTIGGCKPGEATGTTHATLRRVAD